MLSGQILDKDTGAVLWNGSVVDSPAADPSLTADQAAQITGWPPSIYVNWTVEGASSPAGPFLPVTQPAKMAWR